MNAGVSWCASEIGLIGASGWCRSVAWIVTIAERGYRMTIDSQLATTIQFAKRLKKFLRGILASAIYRMNSSILEGIHKKTKVIKRMAYGFGDSANFFLKIKAAFPGKAR